MIYLFIKFMQMLLPHAVGEGLEHVVALNPLFGEHHTLLSSYVSENSNGSQENCDLHISDNFREES